jgi:hypothetical protein
LLIGLTIYPSHSAGGPSSSRYGSPVPVRKATKPVAPKPVLYPKPAPSAIRKLESEGVAVAEVISAEENARDPGYQLAKRGGHGRAMAEHAAPCDSGRRTCFSFAVGVFV